MFRSKRRFSAFRVELRDPTLGSNSKVARLLRASDTAGCHFEAFADRHGRCASRSAGVGAIDVCLQARSRRSMTIREIAASLMAGGARHGWWLMEGRYLATIPVTTSDIR